jgi:hypothetical protein
MENPRRHAVLGCAVTAMLFAGIPAFAGPSITITNLGILPGGTNSSAAAVNGNGAIVGTVRLASGEPAAVRWH